MYVGLSSTLYHHTIPEKWFPLKASELIPCILCAHKQKGGGGGYLVLIVIKGVVIRTIHICMYVPYFLECLPRIQ